MIDTANDATFLEFQEKALPHLYRTATLDEFVVTAMRLIPLLVASDITSYNEVNVEARRLKSIMDSSDAMSIVSEDSVTFDRLLVEENPLVANLMKDRTRPLKISDFLDVTAWQATTIYHRLYGRLGLNYQMAFVLEVAPPTIVAFALNRNKHDFNEIDRARLRVLQSHMTNAYENAIRQEALSTKLTNRGAMIEALDAGWVDLDAALRMTEVSPPVGDIFPEFFGSTVRPNGALPEPLHQWLETALATKSQEPPLPFVAVTEQATLRVSLFGVPRTRHISLMVERTSRGLTPKDLEHLGLTTRQSEILFWISQGKSNADVSVILRISPRTVGNHLARIFDILGVANRTEAASLVLTSGKN